MRVRSRGRGVQRLLRNKPAARAKEICNAMEGPYRVSLVHEKEPCISQIERAAQRRRIEFVQVACDHLDVAQLKGGHYRSRPLNRRLVEINANDPPARADHLGHDRKPADGPTAAVDRIPPMLDTDPGECSAGHFRADLRDAQEPPEVLISTVEDVTPDPLGGSVSHASLPPTWTARI